MPIVRELHSGDVDALVVIEQASTPYPWTRQQFESGLAGGELGWGLQEDGSIVAFALFNTVLDECTLLDTAVAPAYRRRGFARAVLQVAMPALSQRGLVRCLLEVRVSNAGAIALYEQLGFTVDGIRRNYYPLAAGYPLATGYPAATEREDALLMSRPL